MNITAHALTGTLVKVRLPSGALGIYSVQPQHLPRTEIPDSYRWPRELGRHIATFGEAPGFDPAGWWVRVGEDHTGYALVPATVEQAAALDSIPLTEEPQA